MLKYWVIFILSGLFLSTAVQAEEAPFSFEIGKNRTVVLKEGSRSLWQYNADFLKHPGVPDEEPRSMAGCYIHPLYGIDGEVLTDDAPKDHYHHHGVFWNWPHVVLDREDGRSEYYDTWLSNTRMKQLFVRFHDMKIDDDKAIIQVENGWFIAPEVNQYTWDGQGNPTDEKVVDEFVTITTYHAAAEDDIRSRCIDIKLTWVIGKCSIMLQGAQEKSYGGLSVRFRPSSSVPGGDSVITVPEGIAERDLPEKPLPWADYTSLFHRDENAKPIFAGAAGCGHSWHWDRYIAPNNLWHHYSRFTSVVEELDPVKEELKPFELKNERLYLYGLKGKTKTLLWCRDRENTWKTELEEERPPEILSKIKLNLSEILSNRKNFSIFDPWRNIWQNAKIENGKITLPDFQRSLVLVFS